MNDRDAGPTSALPSRERLVSIARVVGPVVLVVLALVVALAVYDAVSGESSNTGVADSYRVVEADESWLDYLPAQGAVPGLSVAGLTSVTEGGPVSRRVDFLVPGVPDGAVSLCFVGFDGDLAAACPDAVALGQVERGVGLPFLGLDGPIGALDWLAVYAAPAPELEDLDYLRR